MLDDAEKYLKRVSQIKRQHFRNGYLKVPHDRQRGHIHSSLVATNSTHIRSNSSRADSAHSLNESATATTPCLSSHCAAHISQNDVNVHREVSPGPAHDGTPTCPATVEEAATERRVDAGGTAVCAVTRDADSTHMSENSASVAHTQISLPPPASPPPRRCVSLMDKWFTGNILCTSTLTLACAPTIDFVNATIRRITAARERVVVLRGAVEDIHAFLLAQHRRATSPVRGDGGGSSSSSDTDKEAKEGASKRRRLDVYGCPVDDAVGKDNSHPGPGTTYLASTKAVVTGPSTCVDPRELVRRYVDKTNWQSVQRTLMSFAGVEVSSLRAARRVMVAHLQHRQGGGCDGAGGSAITALPRQGHVPSWHRWMHTYGPARGGLPSVSMFVWMSSAGTTALFTVLAQQLLRATRRLDNDDGDDVAKCEPETTTACVSSDAGVVPHRPQLWMASDEEEDEEGSSDEGGLGGSKAVSLGACAAGASSSPARAHDTTEGGTTNTAVCAANTVADFTDPPLSRELTDEHRRLLLFLRRFMPMRGSPAGYGVWLLSCLCCLDTPLDPDTDRIMHELFRTTCEQLGVIGKWRGVEGEERRGALLDALEDDDDETEVDARQYNTMHDIRRADVRALHSIIVILAKFFRQNQNRLIVL